MSAEPLPDAALSYAAKGWPVFPLAGKKPRTEHGFLDATRDEGQIRAWWERWPDAGIGIPTGTPSGVVVLDVDPRAGGEVSLGELEKKIGPLPRTLQALTGGGGLHIYFRAPAEPLRCSAGTLGPGLDVKAEGGYVVVPPSVHPNGTLYYWEGSSEPGMVELAECGAPLLARLRNGGPGAVSAESHVVPVHDGQRNVTLTSLAGTMRRRGMTEEAILAALVEDNRQRCKPPLHESEVRTIARSVARYEPADKSLDEPRNAEEVPNGWRSPAQVLEALPAPKFRFSTGIPSLDLAGRGGLPTGSCVVLAGWPDAGKTGLGTQIVVEIARHNEVVAAFFTPDGGQEATAIRIGGLLGLDQDKLEARDPDEKAALAAELRDRRIYIVDYSLDGMVFERIVADAERFRPDLPHVYLLDSAQECLATETADELDERHRVIELMRLAYRTAEANPIPSLVIVTSQVSGAAFAPSRKADRTHPIGSPAESKKISFLSHMIVSLEGDPGKEPNFGRAAVVKSKLRGPKPTFGLRVDAASSRLWEIDAIAAEEAREQTKVRGLENRVVKIADRIEALLRKHGPLLVADIQDRVTGDKAEIRLALNNLEDQGRANWKPAGKTGRGRLWSIESGKGAES